jgi:isopentenyl-diphosphate delta-isomerase
MSDIARRKTDHLDLAVSGDVGFRSTTTLFECVRLVHDALPELDSSAVDLSVDVLGKRLRAPLVIASMTGGTERAGRINRELGSIAEERGYAIGLGSQRAMLRDPSVAPTYQLRSVAPTALLFGNIGVVQASAMSTAELDELAGAVGADALCVHLNPAQELIQPEGDRDFRNGLETLARLATELAVPVIAKETGCGISAHVAQRLRAAGVRHVDVSGAGGTSWVAVETERAEGASREVGQVFREWGIPTAASVGLVAQHGFETVFATGGMQTGLDVAKALALGASAGGIARRVLQAVEHGRSEAVALLAGLEAELRVACTLCGVARAGELRHAPRVVLGELQAWLEQARVDPKNAKKKRGSRPRDGGGGAA